MDWKYIALRILFQMALKWLCKIVLQHSKYSQHKPAGTAVAAAAHSRRMQVHVYVSTQPLFY